MLEALGKRTIEEAIEVMKQIANEFITEQEGEEKLNSEIDSLLNGVDFSEPMSPVDVSYKNMSTHTTSFEVQVGTFFQNSFLFFTIYVHYIVLLLQNFLFFKTGTSI